MAHAGPVATYGAVVGKGNSHFDIHVSEMENSNAGETLLGTLTRAKFRIIKTGRPASDELVVEAAFPLGKTLDDAAGIDKIESSIKAAGIQIVG